MSKLTKTYRIGFDVAGLLLFLLVMLPNFLWFAVPAPNDVLRAESVTPVVDKIASVCQVLIVVCLCFVINNRRDKLRFSPLVFATTVCVIVYYIGWVLYYFGAVDTWIILMLTILPCLAFVLFAADRKNIPAIVFALAFAVCHLVFAIVNFIEENLFSQFWFIKNWLS